MKKIANALLWALGATVIAFILLTGVEAAFGQEECTRLPKLTQELYRPGLVRFHKPTIFKIQGRPGEGYAFFLSQEREPGIRTPSGVRIPIRLFTPNNQIDPLLLASVVYGNTTLFPNFRGVLNPKGQAWPTINLPSLGYFPSLVGFKFYAVGIVADRFNNLQVTNSMALRITG